MKIDPSKIKSWTLESDGQTLKVTTEDNDEDRKSASEAIIANIPLMVVSPQFLQLIFRVGVSFVSSLAKPHFCLGTVFGNPYTLKLNQLLATRNAMCSSAAST